MYRKNNGQAAIFDFILLFGGRLKEDNRWVQLHKMIDWEISLFIIRSISSE